MWFFKRKHVADPLQLADPIQPFPFPAVFPNPHAVWYEGFC